jgi:hypothetical protein
MAGSMFDFDHWCSWVEAQCREATTGQVVLDYKRGQPSPKQGATVAFKTDRKLMQLGFWETGEADFYGIDLPTGADIVGFNGRILDDRSFEQTFRECLSAAA